MGGITPGDVVGVGVGVELTVGVTVGVGVGVVLGVALADAVALGDVASFGVAALEPAASTGCSKVVAPAAAAMTMSVLRRLSCMCYLRKTRY
ncbi:MAG TPA: hypothetical protein VHB69_12310 [Mycobacteriales bacterium]|nr:hypothetical protein [Mycobacteriales bacterium]